jgi:hypothetical protein
VGFSEVDLGGRGDVLLDTMTSIDTNKDEDEFRDAFDQSLSFSAIIGVTGTFYQKGAGTSGPVSPVPGVPWRISDRFTTEGGWDKDVLGPMQWLDIVHPADRGSAAGALAASSPTRMMMFEAQFLKFGGGFTNRSIWFVAKSPLTLSWISSSG